MDIKKNSLLLLGLCCLLSCSLHQSKEQKSKNKNESSTIIPSEDCAAYDSLRSVLHFDSSSNLIAEDSIESFLNKNQLLRQTKLNCCYKNNIDFFSSIVKYKVAIDLISKPITYNSEEHFLVIYYNVSDSTFIGALMLNRNGMPIDERGNYAE